MENAFNLSIQIANDVIKGQFFAYYAKIKSYDIEKDVLQIKKVKAELWGKNFGDGFTNDPDVPDEMKELHKKIFERSFAILNL